MLIPWKASPAAVNHEALFLERYARIRGWLRHLTDNNHELTEDLLHDAFIHFTATNPDINSIQNLDGYLYALVRNLHVSQLRRTAHSRFEQLSILDYDSSEIGLRNVDPRDQLQVRDELLRVCRYACLRKQSAWMASVLILRFFHGYYPSEIAQVLGNTRQSVDVMLRCARREAKAYMENPGGLSFMKDDATTKMLPARSAAQNTKPNLPYAASDILDELRSTVFNAKLGDCLTGKQLRKLYCSNSTEQLGCEELAHVVSCEKCLDEVNRGLDLPLLAARYPAARLGKELRPKDQSGDGGADDDNGDQQGGSRGTSDTSNDQARHKQSLPREFMQNNRRRARETFEHRPQELHIAVNGFTLGSQRINSKLNEQTLDINLAEQIGFVEIFSEQKIRLLFTNVEAPPAGQPKQTVRVDLSDGRTLELLLRFRSPWPTLYVAYHDPTYSEAMECEAVEGQTAVQSTVRQNHAKASDEPSNLNLLRQTLANFKHLLFNSRVLLRPGPVTAVFAVILIAVLLMVQTRITTPSVTAAELLHESTSAEDAIKRAPQTVLHRTVKLEERSTAGDVMARRRVEVWHSAEKGITARRLYDERNQLLAGEWSRTADNSQTSYRRGAKPQATSSVQARAAVPQNLDDAWQLELSAKNFSSLIGRFNQVRVEELPTTYAITHASDEQRAGDAAHGLVKAKLVLARGDLRPVEQTLWVRRAEGELREYHFVEARYEKRLAKDTAPEIFNPEPELLEKTSTEVETKLDSRKDDSESKKKISTLQYPSLALPPSAIASAQLEIEVLNLLTRVGADLGEEVSVRRAAGAPLQVEAIVGTEQRKQEILAAIKPVTDNPAVKVHIETAAEAVKRTQQTGQSSTTAAAAIVVHNAEAVNNTIPVDAEVRRHLVKQTTVNDRIDEEVSRFANRTLKRSQQAVLHIWALRGLMRRFSIEDLRTLDTGARAKWFAMIDKHAGEFARETALLRRDLSPIFNAADATQPTTTTEDDLEITDEAQLFRAVARLIELGSANDSAIQSAFSISTQHPASSTLKTAQFWRSLSVAERLAINIQGATRAAKN